MDYKLVTFMFVYLLSYSECQRNWSVDILSKKVSKTYQSAEKSAYVIVIRKELEVKLLVKNWK